jgi:polar amino acid transport system substrate-binding protein
VLKTKTIKIAIPTDFPPYGFVGLDLQPQGLDVEMAQYIAQKLGVKVELIPVSSPNRIAYIQTKKADLVISTLGKTAEREKVIDFTHAYAPYYQAVYAPKSMSIKSFNDLNGKTVSATRGSLEDTELTKLAPSGAQIKRFEDNSATIAAFVAGQVQMVATGASVAAAMIQKNPQLGAEYKLLIKDSPCYIGVAKGEDALRTKVNEIISAAHKNGELEKLSMKWLSRGTGELPE